MNDFIEPEPEPQNLPEISPQPVPLPPQAYGPFPYEQKNSLGVWALVLGIVSLLCCGLFTGIPAIFVGRSSERAQAEGLANNGNLGRVGWILGIIGSALWLLIIGFYALTMLFPLLLVAGATATY